MSDVQPPSAPAPTIARKRSPNFPGLSLPKAIDRARMIYDRAKAHTVPIRTIAVDYWKYTAPTTGPASVTYAALKRYGLIEDDGTGNERQAHLTDLAIEILLPNPRQATAIREAALAPEIIREWWDKYGFDLPPHESLHWEYVTKGPFADEGLDTFVKVYRDTIEFAKLSKSDSDSREQPDPNKLLGGASDEDENDQKDGADTEPHTRPKRHERIAVKGVVAITVPVPGFAADQPAVVEFPGKLSESEWTYFMAVLGAMKAGVIKTDDETGES